MTAGIEQPRHSNPVADLRPRNSGPNFFNYAGDFMARHNGIFCKREVPQQNFKVAVADAASLDSNNDLSCCGLGNWTILDYELVRLLYDCSLHRALSPGKRTSLYLMSGRRKSVTSSVHPQNNRLRAGKPKPFAG